MVEDLWLRVWGSRCRALNPKEGCRGWGVGSRVPRVSRVWSFKGLEFKGFGVEDRELAPLDTLRPPARGVALGPPLSHPPHFPLCWLDNPAAAYYRVPKVWGLGFRVQTALPSTRHPVGFRGFRVQGSRDLGCRVLGIKRLGFQELRVEGSKG
jgi:hypothetical protein